MPSSTYTVLFWEIVSGGPTYPEFGPSVPAGFVWVIRDVRMYLPETNGRFPVAGQATLSVDGVVVVATPAYRTLANVLYADVDGRQSMAAGSSLEFNASASGWQLRVTGYQLTA